MGARGAGGASSGSGTCSGGTGHRASGMRAGVCLWGLTLRVEQAEDAEGRLLHELDARLVVRVVDADAAYALLGVDLLLHLEDELEEELVQLLVGEVDAQLLEGVDLEDLKAEDVEQSDEGHRIARAAPDRIVHLGDHPVEEQAVDRLAEGVAGGLRLQRRQLDVVDRAGHLHGPLQHQAAHVVAPHER